MIKPQRLKRGDRIALVSLSWGGLGDPPYRHRFEIAKKRLAQDFGLDLVPMPHALAVIKGIIAGKAQGEVYYQAYKEALVDVVAGEEKLTSLPIFYNVNFGHAKPLAILPYGIRTLLDCDRKTLTFLESATL